MGPSVNFTQTLSLKRSKFVQKNEKSEQKLSTPILQDKEIISPIFEIF